MPPTTFVSICNTLHYDTTVESCPTAAGNPTSRHCNCRLSYTLGKCQLEVWVVSICIFDIYRLSDLMDI
ncbi:hypothetical protein I3842_13G115100 [Carya illinoinensis]|uniref:Uncharacterized protein n=1 Tax=Carya illinoinensis TaxID=32201 RepID=A0A922ANP6_CARIL|nr:hypothetical protein I3842_13G115100 [Carya illinoinensis]